MNLSIRQSKVLFHYQIGSNTLSYLSFSVALISDACQHIVMQLLKRIILVTIVGSLLALAGSFSPYLPDR